MYLVVCTELLSADKCVVRGACITNMYKKLNIFKLMHALCLIF